jgi:hypothetical protein
MLQHLFNRKFVLALSLVSVSAFSNPGQQLCSEDFSVLQRTEDSFELITKELKNFKCTNRFESNDFKIVLGVEEEAISFDDDPELVKRAANTYYHLNLAKDFWVNTIKSDYVKTMNQLTVRLEITNLYSRTSHFKNKKQEEVYNNAKSTPAGETPKFLKDKRFWEKEIWFRPKKIIKSKEEVVSKGDNPVHRSLEMVKDPIWDYTKNGLIYQSLSFVAESGDVSSDFVSSAIQKVGILALIYSASEITKEMDKFFINEFYYIDTAMVPEIIYHEFAHVALSDTMRPVHSVPLIEGMADYFAARVQSNDNLDTLYAQLEGYSVNRTKNIENKSLYHPYLEAEWNAESDFVLSLLWKARTNFDTANEKRQEKDQPNLVDFDQLVYQSHFRLDEESDIMHNLTEALLKTCNSVCDSKRYGRDVLHRSFEQKGLN